MILSYSVVRFDQFFFASQLPYIACKRFTGIRLATQIGESQSSMDTITIQRQGLHLSSTVNESRQDRSLTETAVIFYIYL